MNFAIQPRPRHWFASLSKQVLPVSKVGPWPEHWQCHRHLQPECLPLSPFIFLHTTVVSLFSVSTFNVNTEAWSTGHCSDQWNWQCVGQYCKACSWINSMPKINGSRNLGNTCTLRVTVWPSTLIGCSICPQALILVPLADRKVQLLFTKPLFQCHKVP